MNQSDEMTDDELYTVTIQGLYRSIQLLEEFILKRIDPDSLDKEKDRKFLNRVKERVNIGDHPIAIYLKPGG